MSFYLTKRGKIMQNNNIALPLFGVLHNTPIETPEQLLRQCETHGQSVALARKLSKVHRDRSYEAELLGFDNGGYGRLLNGSRNSLVRPDDAYKVFENDVVLDWFCLIRNKVAICNHELQQMKRDLAYYKGLVNAA